MDSLLLLDYPTEAKPVVEDRVLRKRHAETIARAVGRTTTRVAVPPYATNPFTANLEEAIESSRAATVIVDITCLTKAHTVALASLSVALTGATRFIYAYTTPLNYHVSATGRASGWRDVIALPTGDVSRFRREGHARGILLPGHEADRVSVALSALEPAAGVVLVPETPGRPDFRAICEKNHRFVFDRLARLHMPTDAPPSDRIDGWKREIVQLGGFDRMADILRVEIQRAAGEEAPILLFPFGPKPMVLAAALQLAEGYRDLSWCVYPVPASYDVDYSFGTANCHWLGRTLVSDS